MALTRGTRIGSYDVAEQIGAGGMGEVYRAHDARLDRDVALKVLPAGVAADADRLARLQREARTLAALNHPHIAQIYGLEEAAGVTALVMELVEGATLADRIAQGPLPIEEALPIARQVAEALEAAHEQGIIHRDLKPANIKVRPDGAVKVLDFGLARAVESSSGHSSASLLPTLTSPAMMTGVGVVLGTAAYMSPEQAKGRAVDRRADIWAFGVVFVEMLTGRTMFAGESVTETIASVMKDAPVIPDAPPAIRALLGRCLERDPRKRLRDIGEARIVLEDPAALNVERSAAPAAEPRGTRRTWAWVAGVVLAAVAAGVGTWMIRPAPQSDIVPLRKFSLPVEGLNSGPAGAPRISPDGTKIVYASAGRLFVRDLASIEARELTTGERPAYFVWSPDSSQIAYLSGDRLYKVAIAGGAPAVVSVLRQGLGSGVGLAWGSDGRILLTTALPGSGIQYVSADGGDLTTLVAVEPPAEQDFHEVSILPDGRGLLYAVDRGSGVMDTLAVFDGTAKKTVLHLEGELLRFPVYVRSGHILYERITNNAGIWAMPFSLSTLAATGEPFLVSPQSALPSVSDEGTLLYVPQAPPAPFELIAVDLTGKVMSTIGPPQTGLTTPRVSPDGRFVAAAAQSNSRTDVWLNDVLRGSRTRLTFGEGEEVPQAWSPASDRVFFVRTVPPGQARTIASQAADGTGQLADVVASQLAGAFDVSRDGRFLVYTDAGKEPAKTAQDLYYVALDGGTRTPTLFLDAPTSQTEPRFSPDGAYVAYSSNESGRAEVYLKPFPGGDGKWQVSVNGGVAPRWDANGRLFYVEPGTDAVIMQVEITRAPALTIGTPRRLFAASTLSRRTGNGWDVFPDGKRFVFLATIQSNQPPPTPAITFVQNWFAEFRDRHPPQ